MGKTKPAKEGQNKNLDKNSNNSSTKLQKYNVSKELDLDSDSPSCQGKQKPVSEFSLTSTPNIRSKDRPKREKKSLKDLRVVVKTHRQLNKAVSDSTDQPDNSISEDSTADQQDQCEKVVEPQFSEIDNQQLNLFNANDCDDDILIAVNPQDNEFDPEFEFTYQGRNRSTAIIPKGLPKIIEKQ